MHSIGFCHCDSVDLTLQFLEQIKLWMMFDTNMLKLLRMSLLGGINFVSLTHFDMLQLLIMLCLNFLTKQ